jgi:CO/xanthine dehydrogenase FAD-binding subunit
VARRLTALEAELTGRAASPDLGAVVRPDHVAGLTPIDDVRGTAAYRSDAVLTLIRRALAEAAR